MSTIYEIVVNYFSVICISNEPSWMFSISVFVNIFQGRCGECVVCH